MTDHPTSARMLGTCRPVPFSRQRPSSGAWRPCARRMPRVTNRSPASGWARSSSWPRSSRRCRRPRSSCCSRATIIRSGSAPSASWTGRRGTGRRPLSDVASCSTCTSAGTTGSTRGTSSIEARSTSWASTWSTSRGTSSTSWRVPRNRWSGEPRSSAPTPSSGAIELDDTYRIAETLANDPDDLVDKSVGWMLREAGKRDRGPARLVPGCPRGDHAAGDAPLFDREAGQVRA